jgi:hypothetical protein
MSFVAWATTVHLFFGGDGDFAGFTQADVDAYEENFEFVT